MNKRTLAKRLKSLQRLVSQKNLHALWITNPVNIKYLSGFSGSSATLLIGTKEAYILTDFRYLSQAAAQCPCFEVYKVKEDLVQDVKPLLKEKEWKKIGFEAKYLVVASHTEMSEQLEIELVPLRESAEKLRMVKNSLEQDILRRGAAVLDKGFTFIQSIIRPGISEEELSLEVEIFLRRLGAEGTSFNFIVASGHRGALPHGVASEKMIESGEMVTIDFGAVFEGYATDMTRTLAVRKTDQQMVKIYDIVYKAQKKAAAAVKPGMECRDLDAVARKIIRRSGYGEYFGHGLGHGIGLETHEQPVVNRKSKTVLEPGMVITIEPGIYIPDVGGVRIEDMVLVTETGHELLTNSPKELINI